MRFMVIVKAGKSSEAGALPSAKMLDEMGRFNEELAKAGMLLAAEGLQPSSKGARVFFRGNQRTVRSGPFPETASLVAGFWLWQCASLEAAIDWVKRCPHPMPGEEAEIEIRQVFEAEDFGPARSPEQRAQEARLRVKAIPAGHRTVTPYMTVKNGLQALAFYKKAFGAKERKPVMDQFYGDRSGQLEDPFGHLWWVATHTEDIAPEEMQQRVNTMFAGKQAD